jgi:hypothetical protein
MLQMHVDGQSFAGAERARTFGEVLDVVEPAVAGRSRIVTAFRVNGVDEPAFREPGVRGRTLQEGDRLDLATTTAAQLATDALADTVRLTPSLCAAATQTADQLRTTAAPAAAQELGPLAEGLTLLVTLVQAAEAWADAAAMDRDSWLGADVLAVARCIEALEEAQRAEDWVSTADVLTYDLVPALEGWRARLEAALAGLTSHEVEVDAAEV